MAWTIWRFHSPLLQLLLVTFVLLGATRPVWAVPQVATGLQCLGRVTPSGPILGQPSTSAADSIQASSATLGTGCTVAANASYGRLGALAGVLLNDSPADSASSRAIATFREEEFSLSFTGGTPTGVVSALFSWELSGGFSGTLGPQADGAFSTQAILQTSIFHGSGIERYSETRGVLSSGQVTGLVTDPNEMFEFDPTQPFTITGSLDARAEWRSNPSVALVTGDAVAGFLGTAELAALQLFVDGVELDPSLYSISSASGSFIVPEPSTGLLLLLGLGGLAYRGQSNRRRDAPRPTQ